MKLLSDVQLSAKVALQKAGVTPAPARMIVQVQREGPLSASRAADGSTEPARAADEMRSNLQHDTEAATLASAQLPGDQENEIRHALDNAGQGIGDEGRNLIEEKPARDPERSEERIRSKHQGLCPA